MLQKEEAFNECLLIFTFDDFSCLLRVGMVWL